MDIEWKEGAVCFACNHQWRLGDKVGDGNGGVRPVDIEALISMIDKPYFQLNEPRQGDYIPKSELDTEQKYNDAVEVFGLFGYERVKSYESFLDYHSLYLGDNRVISCPKHYGGKERKLTYDQLMAIGKLKRLMNERNNLKRWGEYSRCVQVDLGDVKAKEVTMQKNKPVVAQVMIDLTERMEIGIKTYGEALRANNGRDALQDAYEEALDLACYLKQAMIERDNENTN